jgi:hypothetical protein
MFSTDLDLNFEEFVISPSFVFELISEEQVKWLRPVGYSYTLQVSLCKNSFKSFGLYNIFLLTQTL